MLSVLSALLGNSQSCTHRWSLSPLVCYPVNFQISCWIWSLWIEALSYLHVDDPRHSTAINHCYSSTAVIGRWKMRWTTFHRTCLTEFPRLHSTSGTEIKPTYIETLLWNFTTHKVIKWYSTVFYPIQLWQAEWALKTVAPRGQDTPQISNHALDWTNYCFGLFIIHGLLFLIYTDTGKTLSSRVTESRINLLSLSATLIDSQPQNWMHRSILGRFQMTVFLERLIRDRALRGYDLGMVYHSEPPFPSLGQFTQEQKMIYFDRLSIKAAISNPVKGLLCWMNRYKQGSFRNTSRILPRRDIQSNQATENRLLFQDHSRGKHKVPTPSFCDHSFQSGWQH
jgi:hypothetical protein